MRRTTIFRSKWAVIAGVAAGIAAATPATAQDTLFIPTDQMGDQPRVHVVQGGETLWDLATLYLGDPLLWPEIYRLNTLTVEDPHWIFPGEELTLVPVEPRQIGDATAPIIDQTQPGEIPVTPPEQPLDTLLEIPDPGDPGFQDQTILDTAQALPPPPVAPAVSSAGPTVFTQGNRAGESSLTVARSARIRSDGRREFYAAGFLTEGQDFPWADVAGPVDQAALATLPQSSSAVVHELIRIEAPRDAVYQVGDSLLAVTRGRRVRGWGQVIVPSGIVRVVSVDGRDVRAEILTQFFRVTDAQSAIPIERYAGRRNRQPRPIENGMEGEIIVPRDVHPVMGMHDIVFIDLGREDGVVPGDVFEVLVDEANDAGYRRAIAQMEIVHVRDRSASGEIQRVMDSGTAPGVTVRLIRKMPS